MFLHLYPSMRHVYPLKLISKFLGQNFEMSALNCIVHTVNYSKSKLAREAALVLPYHWEGAQEIERSIPSGGLQPQNKKLLISIPAHIKLMFFYIFSGQMAYRQGVLFKLSSVATNLQAALLPTSIQAFPCHDVDDLAAALFAISWPWKGDTLEPWRQI